MTARTADGSALTAGVNVDRIDIAAGINEARTCGYDAGRDFMVVQYALQRWMRGEEDGAIKTLRGHGIDLPSAYRIVAAARASAEALEVPAAG